MAKSSTCNKRGGFSLLEISIVLAIISVILGGGLAVFISSLQNRALSETQNKMHVLQQALYNFRVAYNRLPCPADETQAMSAQNFGIEALPHGDCTGTGGKTPAANFPGNGGTPNDVEGMVPTKTLQLPDDMAIDGWGRRIAYAVDSSFTADSNTTTGQPAFTVIPASDTTVRMSICDATGTNSGVCNNAKTTFAAYVLISFGPNGHGAFPRNGAALTGRISSGSVNADELVDCDCTSSAAVNGTPPAGVFVQKAATQDYTNPTHTDDFDDVVVYATRSDLRTLGE